MGVTVFITSQVGHGFPDLVLGLCNRNILVEVKDGTKSKSRRQLTDDEAAFHRTWRGQVCIIESIAEAITLVNRIRRGLI